MIGPLMTTVGIGFAAFSPAQVTVLPGDHVHFANDSVRAHTVTADDGSFDSGRLATGATYDRVAGAPGVIAYHCTLHAGMRGAIDVRRLLLTAPTAPAAPRRAYPLRGRAALPAGTDVTLEADTGLGFAAAGRATVAQDGTFTALVTPTTSGSWRAVAEDAVSDPVALRVLDRSVRLTAQRRHGRDVLTATVTPADPGATVVLQLRIPERFGWWPVQRVRLDGRSRARFVVRTGRRLPARVHLTLRDGATTLAESRIVHVGTR